MHSVYTKQKQALVSTLQATKLAGLTRSKLISPQQMTWPENQSFFPLSQESQLITS